MIGYGLVTMFHSLIFSFFFVVVDDIIDRDFLDLGGTFFFFFFFFFFFL